jgi:hypothetical protein
MKRKIEVVSMLVRVPPPLKEWIEQRAVENCTSANAEVIRAIRARMDSEQPAVG